jgi:hypothetical protein
MEPLWTRLQAEREQDVKAKQEKPRADWAKIDADREERKADMKAFNEMMERREAERKVDKEKRMAERKAEQERRKAERKVDREMATRLKAIHKTDASQIRVEPETEHQEKMAAWITDTKNDRKETTACQDAMETNLEKMEPNPGEKEAVVERQEIHNEEVAIHSLRAYRNGRTACQEATKTNPEKMEPIDRATAILEQMIAMTKTNQEMMEATDLKGNPEEMERESEHREVPKGNAAVMPV